MQQIVKRLMFCHNAKTLSFIVAGIHLLWSIRMLYFITVDLIDYNDEDNQQLSEDGIFDMPIPAVRYLLLLYLLVFISSIFLIIGILMNRCLCVSTFLLTMVIFILTFVVFDFWDVFASFSKGTPMGEIFQEFSNDTSLLVGEFLMLNPVFLVLSDILEVPPAESNSTVSLQTLPARPNNTRRRGHAV